MDTSESPAAFNWDQAFLSHRDCLPHLRQDNVIYFVTFRLADSLPAERVRELQNQRAAWLAANPLPHSPDQQREYRRLWTVRIENLMDAGCGSCVLRDPRCRQLLDGAIRRGDGLAYALGPYVIMPNHVHVLIHMSGSEELGRVVKAWKAVSGRGINRLLHRSGVLWMEEYFDHIVRDAAAYARFVEYIRRNPVRLPEGSYTLGEGTLHPWS